jgi:light-regulated signal transduction histidine kinase (bacteriophytochrome)
MMTLEPTLEQQLVERTAELRRSKELLSLTSQLARVGGWEIDLVKNELAWDDMVREIHEVEPHYQPNLEAALGFYAPEAVPVISEAVRRAIEEAQPFDVELQLITATRRRLWVRAVGKAFRENGKVIRVSGALQDVDARRLAETVLKANQVDLADLQRLVEEGTRDLSAAVERLTVSNKELEQFAYVASHDLQEPLRMVASYTQLLAERYQGRLDDKADKYIGYAVDGAKRMQGLINDLLQFSRVGRHDLAIEATDCNEVVAGVLQSLAKSIEESHAVVSVGELPTIPGDRLQLGQLFQNLIANALKFRGDQEPRIRIASQRCDAFWEISVADNGIGIDPQFHDRIFIIFQRLHQRGAYPGSGIGLAIVKKIVEGHGGSIRVVSEAGKGACFRFTLPVEGKVGRD